MPIIGRRYPSVNTDMAAIYREMARTSPEFAVLAGLVPAEAEEDRVDLSGDDLDGHDAAWPPELEWWRDLERETVSDHYGTPQRSPLEPSIDYDRSWHSRELYESAVVAHQTGRYSRGGGTRVDAEEEARMWGRGY